MTCLPSLNGCNHNKSASLLETKHGSVKEKQSVIHFCLFSPPTCLFKVEQNLPTDAAGPGNMTADWLLACGRLIWIFPVEMVPFNQEASVSSTNMLKNQRCYFHAQGSSLLSCVRCCSCHPGVCPPFYQAAFPLCGIRKPTGGNVRWTQHILVFLLWT